MERVHLSKPVRNKEAIEVHKSIAWSVLLLTRFVYKNSLVKIRKSRDLPKKV